MKAASDPFFPGESISSVSRLKTYDAAKPLFADGPSERTKAAPFQNSNSAITFKSRISVARSSAVS